MCPTQVMAQEECNADINSDGLVGVDDMLQVLGSYGTGGCSTDTPGCPLGGTDTGGSIYVSSFNEFCSGALPDGVTAIREQSKCWICEDIIRSYLNGGMSWLPPAGTNFSPDSSVQHILGYDFFVFGYDSDGNYQGTPAWNDAGLGGWPPAYVGDCNAGYNEDFTACIASVGGTYTIPTQACMDVCGAATCPDATEACREHYTSHDQEVTGGGTTFYSEKVEHQYELTEMATNGAFFHGYFLDGFGLVGETVYTQPDGAGGFMSCAFNDYEWESSNNAAAAAIEAQATAAASIYVSSFNEFCSGALPDGVTAIREQTKCWICEDVIRSYIKSWDDGSPWLPPAGTNFSPDSNVQHILGYDFFVFGYDADGNYQGTPAWNDAGQGGWPPAYVGDCNAGYNEDFTACIASVGGTYTIPEQSCMEMCGAASCPDATDACREHYTVHDQEVTSGGTTFYSEKVEHQYELTAKATAGAFFHGYFLDGFGLVGETVYTQPAGPGGFMSCAFNDYTWEVAIDLPSKLATMQAALDTLVAASGGR